MKDTNSQPITERTLEEMEKRIQDLEERLIGTEIALRGVAHRGAEIQQLFEQSQYTSEREYIDLIISTLKNSFDY